MAVNSSADKPKALSGRIWDSIVGHKVTIGRMITMAEAGRVPNSLLFVGPTGQGKKLVALGLVQALLCEHSLQACGVCSSCRRVTNLQSEGLILLEPEKGQIKIESAREIVRQLSLANWGKVRVVIIDDAHLLNVQAANALLKVIEEPPAATHFILISSSQESVLKTLRSRSQIVRFRGLSRAELAQIDRSVEIEPASRDRVVTFWREILHGSDVAAIEHLRETVEGRESGLELTRMGLELIRDIWLGQKGLGPVIHENWRQVISESNLVSEKWLSDLSEKLLLLERDLKGHCDVQLAFENFVYQAREQPRAL